MKHYLLLIGALGCITPLHALAQDGAHASAQGVAQDGAAASEIEVFPDFMVRRIEEDAFETAANKAVAEGKVLQGLVSDAKKWDTSGPIRVCFFGGPRDLRRRIAVAASEWELPGTRIKFDFGDAENPRFCSAGEFNQIRVGYTLRGYWSLVGQDSIALARQSETSLNLARFDMGTPSETEFRRLVLHEFGHALGLQHEQQNRLGKCEEEFDWDAIYAYMAREPYRWSKDTVDLNMRPRPYLDGEIATRFNRNSIMLYSFPTQFYKRGSESPCYTTLNTSISDGDRETIKLVYAGDDRGEHGETFDRLSAVLPALAPNDVGAVQDRVALLKADPETQARIIGAVREEFVDVDVFRCSDDAATTSLFEKATRALSDVQYIGRLRARGRVWPGDSAIKDGINIVADAAHPESRDARRVASALQSQFPGKVSVVENSGDASPWYLSIVACAK